MHRFLWPALGLSFAVSLSAQQTHVIPNGMAAVPGSTSNNFPWGTSGSTSNGIRVLSCYDSANFTDAGVDYPVTITRLRWRANDSSLVWAGGSYSQATVSLSTAAVDYAAVSTMWASNHGPDLTVCHSGAVVMQPGIGRGQGLPGPFHIDVPLSTPFVYDPAQGDLCIDCDWPGGAWAGGTRTPLDIDGSAMGRASRVFSSSQYPNANGTTQDHGVIVEVTYAPALANTATAFPYGDGCYDGHASFYEIFPAGAVDLSNSGITLQPTSIGYLALPGAGAWFTPTSTPIQMAGNGVTAAQPLGFTFAYPGGSTQAIHISSNGFVWADPNFSNGCCVPTPAEFLLLPPRWAALWADLDASTGSVTFDTDPVLGAAYVTFTTVPEAGVAQNLNTFQVAFFASGNVEYRYGQCAITNHVTLVGWTPGNGARDPGTTDLTVSLPIVTQPDLEPPLLTTNGRPILGASVPMIASRLPQATAVGAFFAGLTQHDPGLPLAGLGMQGCQQLASLDASLLFFPTNGTGSAPFAIPGSATFVGLHVYVQAAAIAPGANVLGVINSNGIDLQVGTQ